MARLIGPSSCICRQWSIAAATQAALGSCRDRPSSAPACRRATWWRTAPSVTPRSRAMWLLVAPRAAKVLMVMRASVSSRLILASAPRNGAVRGSQPETTARKSGRRLTRRCPVALQHQALNDEIRVALEARAGRHRSREDPILDGYARPHRATAALHRARRLRLAGLLHPTRPERWPTLQPFEPRDLGPLGRHRLLQGRHLAQQPDDKRLQIRRGEGV